MYILFFYVHEHVFCEFGMVICVLLHFLGHVPCNPSTLDVMGDCPFKWILLILLTERY